MAGLLDFLNTADGQMGLGLLAAAGPRSDGAGFGQRLMEGVGAGDAWRAKQQALAMQKMQMDNYASEIETRKASIAKQADTQAALERILGGGGGSGGGLMGMSPGAFQPSADGMGPTLPAQQPNRTAGIGGMSINDVAALKGRGIDLMKEFEWANNPQKLEQGSTYQDRITGKERFMPKTDAGIAPNAQGVYAELPGYGPAQASIEGAKTSATEAAKAGLDLVSVPTGNGQTMMVPRARAVQMLNGQAPSSQPATGPAAGPAGYANEGQMRNTVAGDMGADPKALQREISAVKSDLMKPLDPASKLALQTHLSDLMGQAQKAGTASQSPTQFGVTQSEAEKARAVKTAEADVVRDTTKQTSGKMYGQMKEGVNRALELLNQGPTASGLGSLRDSAYGLVGASTQAGDTASKLETLGGWLTANVPRMEGPQSDRDVMNYRIMAGRVGDKSVPLSQRIAAANEVGTLQNKYAELNGYASGKPTEQKAPLVPMKGMVNGGYKFNGGDPSVQSNWEKM